MPFHPPESDRPVNVIQQTFVDRIQGFLRAIWHHCPFVDGYNNPLFRPDNPVLPLSAIKSIHAGPTAGPELIAVSTSSVPLLRRIGIRGLNAQGVFHKIRIEDLFPSPVPHIAVEHGQPEIVFRGGKGPGLRIDPVAEFQPYEPFAVDSDFFEQPRRQVFFQIFSRFF